MNERFDKIDDKLDIIIQKVSKLEVKVELTTEEIKAIKSSTKEHDVFINRLKGGIALVGFVGITTLIKYLFIG